MNLSLLKNNRGLTLTELIVAMGISSILFVFVVSGSLFVQDYLKNWKRKDNIFEELSFLNQELSKTVFSSRWINLYQDSLVCWSKTDDKTSYRWGDGSMYKNGVSLSRSGLSLDSIAITSIELRKQGDSVIFYRGQGARHPGLYEIFVVVSDDKNLADSIRSVVKNEHAITKYYQK